MSLGGEIGSFLTLMEEELLEGGGELLEIERVGIPPGLP
jgi:hypothetical protein